MIARKVFRLETEAPEETTMTDKVTVPPIEEASTEDVIVPKVASDRLDGLYFCVYLDLSELVNFARFKNSRLREMYISTEKLLL